MKKAKIKQTITTVSKQRAQLFKSIVQFASRSKVIQGGLNQVLKVSMSMSMFMRRPCVHKCIQVWWVCCFGSQASPLKIEDEDEQIRELQVDTHLHLYTWIHWVRVKVVTRETWMPWPHKSHLLVGHVAMSLGSGRGNKKEGKGTQKILETRTQGTHGRGQTNCDLCGLFANVIYWCTVNRQVKMAHNNWVLSLPCFAVSLFVFVSSSASGHQVKQALEELKSEFTVKSIKLPIKLISGEDWGSCKP